MVIHCISGLGADEKVFSRLSLPGVELRPVPWLKPERKESIRHYGARMNEQISGDLPILLGVSFGGVMSLEIAKIRPTKKVVIVSSVSNHHQLPIWMRISGRTGLNKIAPIRPFKFLRPIQNRLLGAITAEERSIADHYRSKADPVYLKWAVNTILNWKNDWQPDSFVHIHGDQDRMFPIRYVRPTHTIAGGNHFMVYNRAEEVSRLLIEVGCAEL
jgi:pimeloyl-ACP methyl ester carboxylesterase